MSLKQRQEQPQENLLPRWKRILNLHDSVKLHCLHTGRIFTRGEIVKPDLGPNDVLREFIHKPSGELIYIDFIRKIGDNARHCSL